MKIANVRSMMTKGVTIGLVAGALALAAPAKADAQVVVRVGYPHSVYGPDYYARLRFEEARRHDAWARAHAYRPYAYRYGYGYRGRW
jgi:ABC-type sugar transport system substrate-binding protein